MTYLNRDVSVPSTFKTFRSPRLVRTLCSHVFFIVAVVASRLLRTRLAGTLVFLNSGRLRNRLRPSALLLLVRDEPLSSLLDGCSTIQHRLMDFFVYYPVYDVFYFGFFLYIGMIGYFQHAIHVGQTRLVAFLSRLSKLLMYLPTVGLSGELSD